MQPITNFDLALWKKRATEKRNSLSKKNARTRISEDARYLKALQYLVRYGMANDQLSFLFTTTPFDQWYSNEDQTISVCRNNKPKTQFFIALHEYGHFLAEKSETHLKYQSCAEPGYDKFANATSMTGRCQILGEEFEAWHQGFQLAVDLGLLHPVDDRSDFEKTKCRYLNTYLKWAVGLQKG